MKIFLLNLMWKCIF